MIKFEIEIKDEQFIYNYTIAEDRQHGTTPLNSDALYAFNELLRIFQGVSNHSHKLWERKALQEAANQACTEKKDE